MPDTRRFALIAPNYHPLTCGVGDNTMRLGAELRRRGLHAVVFTHTPAAPHPEAPALPVRGIEGTGPFTIAGRMGPAIDPAEFTHVIIQYAPQMWGASRFGSLGIPWLAAALRQRGLRVTLILHELFTPWRPRPDLAIGAALFRLQLAAVMRSCDRIYATTDSRVRSIAHAAASMRQPQRVLTYRIGSGALPEPRTAGSSGRRIGLFSTLAIGKSFEIVVEAFTQVARTHPDAELLLLGDLGPPDSSRLVALKRQIEVSGVSDRVRTPGKLPLDEVARLVASLDLYLFPIDTGANTRSSTLPLALGAGVPVVAIAGSETDSLFEHRENVFFAESLSGPAFAGAALAVLGDAALGARLAAGGRAVYERHLTWTRIADDLLSTID